MDDMATKTLKLKIHNDGTYFTRWYDDDGVRRFRRFGKNHDRAMSRFSQFYYKWRNHPDVRSGNDDGVMNLQRLWDSFYQWADKYYRDANGTPTREATNLKHAFFHALKLYNGLDVDKFRASHLKEIRQNMEEAKKPNGDPRYSRSTINTRISKIRQVFKWGLGEEMVPADVLVSLQSVKAISYGRTQAREKPKPKAVPDHYVDAVCLVAPPTIRAMIQVHRLTGMRPGEVVIMRPCDIDMAGDVWLYTPSTHKLSHREKDRVVCIGPNAQEYITPYIKFDTQQYIFSPKTAMDERYSKCDTHRREKQAPTLRTTGRKVGEKYTTNTYAQAITKLCKKHKIMHWSPNQLRHNFLTKVRQTHTLDHSQAVGGHSDQRTTQRYAAPGNDLAIQVAIAIG